METLKRRADFLRVQKGRKWVTPAFVLQARKRDGDDQITGPRFGFTVTRRLGKAVVRNRIRRRLKAAMGQLAGKVARDDHDYVLIARQDALSRDFQKLLADMRWAFRRIHEPRGDGGTGRRMPQKKVS